MRKLIVTALAGFIFLTTSSSSCKKKNNDGDCKDVMCTAMFAMINTKVTDANGHYVKLDEVYTQRVSNKDIYRPDPAMMAFDSTYIVLDDSYLTKLQNQTDSFYFIGIKNGVKVVNEPFVLGADCCHVSKQSGKTMIVVN